jgi:penicillin-binding protein 1B
MAKRKHRLRRGVLYALGLALGGAVVYGGYLAWVVTSEFGERRWDRPAQVYAAPLELYAGRQLNAEDFMIELVRLGYRGVDGEVRIGTFRRDANRVTVGRRAFEAEGTDYPSRMLELRFARGRVDRIADDAGGEVAIAQLDPLLIGSIFPVHGEDRLIVEPEDVPPLLTAALIAVEDRRFQRHLGVDLRAIARAALVNLREGEIQQGGSTLTQQLVRSYFLTNDRTWRRKLREAFMAVALEIRHDKRELLHAYVNEIYLGQDGARAIHGFGLASRFYFGKPLSELEIHEIALLIAEVRGPSYYDPRRRPERARARRDLVLDQMLAFELISRDAHDEAAARDLGIVTAASRQSAYYSAFLDLVRRQLERDYRPEDLQATGLKVYTTLDPTTQASAEVALVDEIAQLQSGRPELEGALIVTNPHNAEVRALVGSRQTGFDGFNRALDARRQVGSLIKPVVYLAALESERHTFATLIDDEAIDVELDNGTIWSPRNFNDEAHGTVTALRALVESFNMATVRLGLDVGLEPVTDLLVRLGLERAPARYPSLLLGALELTPIEVTQIYNTLANGGFYVPLKAVRSVVDASGEDIQRFGLELREASNPAAVYALNQALVQVMERGTGRTARAMLPDGLETAGKTGTSDEFRDSWFAGFSNDYLVVTWVGNDANESIGLTGGTGASRVWARVVADLQAHSYGAPMPDSLESAWIDYNTGLETDPRCPDAVRLAMPADDLPPTASACGSDKIRVGSRIRRWLRDRLN